MRPLFRTPAGLLLLAGLICLQTAAAQKLPPLSADGVTSLGATDNAGRLRYQLPLRFEPAPDLSAIDTPFKAIYYDNIATFWSFVGETAKANACFDSTNKYRGYERPYVPGPHDSLFVASFSAAPALPALAALSRNTRLVFINEAHHRPEHRLFTYAALKTLRAEGYTHLALETFSHIPGPGANGVRQNKGYYTMEPEMANMVRQAQLLGFALVAYDCNGCTDMRERERVAAHNLARVLDSSANVRMVVHCGYGHGSLAPMGDFETVGSLLTRRYRQAFRPVSVTQTVFMDQGVNGLYQRVYQKLEKTNTTGPLMVLQEGHAVDLLRDSSYSMTVIQRPLREESLQSFMWTGMRRYPVTLPEGVPNASLLQLFPVAEINNDDDLDKVVPAANRLLHAARTRYAVLVPAGSYVYVLRDDQDRIIYRKTIRLK